MDFLDLHRVVIDLRSKSITLFKDNATAPLRSDAYHALNVTEERVTLPLRCSVIIPVATKAPTNLQDIIEGNQHLLLNHEMCVARGITL